MRRLVYLLVLFVMSITSAKAEIFYSTLKIGEQTTLNAYASPSSNHYISKYEWWFPSVCVTAAGGGSRFDSYCTILATGATKYVAGGQVEVKCHVYQREYGHSIDTPLTTVTFVITVNENGGGEIEGGTDIKLVSSSPKDGDTDVDVNVKPVLQFNQAVSYVSNKPISQWIRLETDYGSKIYVDSHFATNIKADGTSETQVTITPQKPLQTGTHYTLIIPAGSLKLRNGSQNSNEHRIGFTTKDVNTSIATPVLKETKKGLVYDMSGRRLNAPKKGINIINGKKYICK